MKTVIFLITVLMSVSVFARMETSRGSGSASGFCDGGSMGYWCVDNLKQQARRDAISRAELDCRIRNGQPQGSYMASCGFEYCSPGYIPPDASNQYVSCRSDCNLGCEIREN
jgi:hypothetical protein